MTWILLAIVVVLLVASAFFVAAEFSLVAARRTQIEPLAPDSARARATLAAMEEVSVMMACAQLGITACGVLLGAIGEPAVAHLLHPLVGAAGLPSGVTEGLSLAIALLLVVGAHVAFGEMVPKNIALAGPESVALALAPPLRAIARALGPVVRGLNHFANGVARLMGFEVGDEVASAFTREDVANLVQQSASEGLIDPEDERLIGSALQFETGTVADVMVTADRLVVLEADASAADVERACAKYGFSRFPIRGTDVGDDRSAHGGEPGLRGFVHVRDALRVPDEARNAPLPPEAVRPLHETTPQASLRVAADLMRSKRVHMARVSLAGATVGVVMLEDVIEALVGDVVDATRRARRGSLG